MHKMVLKIFDFFRNSLCFLRILPIFFLLLHLLSWIQHLINGNFAWLKPFEGILNFFIYCGGLVSTKSIDLWGSVFEYKYMIAVGIYVGIYYICNLMLKMLDKLEDQYDDLRRFMNKTNEQYCNVMLQSSIEKQELQINLYKIFIKTSLKKGFAHPEFGYDINEQNQNMNKFVISKTGSSPIYHEGGYLYSFNNFNDIDSVLQIMFKLIKSNSVLDYTICVQVVESDEVTCLSSLKRLSELNHVNKITMFADSAYRYRFNKDQKYGTSQLGLFQQGNETLEVHEFIEI